VRQQLLPLAAIGVCAIAFGADTKGTTVLIANPGFEKGLEGWSVDEARFGGMVTVVQTPKHAGESAIKISDPKAGASPYCAQSVTGLEGGATYRFRAWVASEKGEGAQAALKIEFYNEKGVNTSGQYGQVRTNADGTWQVAEVVAKADPDATRAALLLRLYSKGTLYYDDAEMAKVKDAPPLSLTPARMAVAPNAKTDVRVELRFSKSSPDKPAAVFELQRSGRGAESVKFDLEAGGTNVWAATLHLSELPPGQYGLKCKVASAKAEASAYLFVPPEKRKPVWLSDTGTITLGGQPYFPIGLYHVGVADYPALAEKGFNCVQGDPTSDMRVLGSGLNAAKAAGIMVDVPLYFAGQVLRNVPNSLQKLKTYSAHGSVLDWKIIDEPDLRPEVIDEVPATYELLKKEDPQRPLLLTIASPGSYAYWANFCDILQIDPYPIPTQPLTMVSDYTAKAKAALQPWQNLTVVLQCGWVADPINQPSLEQARCMVYLALINGAKGLFWYSMHDPGWDLTKTPLWGRFKELNEETAALGKPVLSGEKVEVKGVAAPVQALCVRYEGKHYLLLANPGKDPVEAVAELPVDIKKAAPRGKSVVSSEGKTVRVKLPGTGAEMVTIE
jgi:hypothetical protein